MLESQPTRSSCETTKRKGSVQKQVALDWVHSAGVRRTVECVAVFLVSDKYDMEKQHSVNILEVGSSKSSGFRTLPGEVVTELVALAWGTGGRVGCRERFNNRDGSKSM
ncbi:hypothetical protein Tco_0691565 [Tanacetum coccineum]